MKITSASIAIIAVLASHVNDVLALNGRSLESGDDVIEVNAGQSKPFGTSKKSKKEDDVAIITNLSQRCYYQFEDEDSYKLIKDADSAMTCAFNICNVDFVGDDVQDAGLVTTTNRIVGLKLQPKPDTTDELISTFAVGCGLKNDGVTYKKWKAIFTCPAGYFVSSLRTFERGVTGSVTVCNTSSSPAGQDYRRQVCMDVVDSGGIEADPNFYYRLICKENQADSWPGV